MGARGPKPAIEQAWVADAAARIPGLRQEPPAPPADLEPDEAEQWRIITGRMPPNWFTAENLELLVQLCRHICYAREIAAMRRALRARLTADGCDLLVDGEYSRRVRELMTDHGFHARIIANLATKLRLTQQSRYVPSELKRDHDDERASSAVTPWDGWLEDGPRQ